MKRKITFFLKIAPVSLLLIFVFLINGISIAQNIKQVTGRVTDSRGEPLAGVNILVKGTSTGATSDVTGAYTINASDNSVLVFSYIGSAGTEMRVNGRSAINIKLESEDKSLSDVVVIGYGTQKKVNVIGSVVTVGTKELVASPVSSISNALAGRLPGAVIQQTSGEPGNDASTITIRGLSTLGNNQPLVVIDGVQGRDMNSLNSNDVESISILKDAAAGIYGARAANGVILITTKHGKEGPLTVNYGFYQGFLSPTALPKMADAATYASMIREAQTYEGINESNMKFTQNDIDRYKSGKFPWTNPNTNWVDASFNKYTLSRNHFVSLSGGGKAVDYYLSFGSQSDAGIFKNSSTSFNRYNLKATIDAKVNEYITLSYDLNGSQEHRIYPSVDAGFNLDGAIKSLPTSPAYYPNGLPGPDIAYGQNPVVTVTDQTGFDNGNRYRLNNLFSANIKIPGVKGLSLSGYYAYDLNIGSRKLFQKPWTLYQLDEGSYLAAGNTGVEDGSAFLTGSLKGASTDPLLNNYNDNATTKTFNGKLDYTTTINGVHNISAFIALETAEYISDTTNAFRRHFFSDQLPYLFAGGNAEKTNNEFVGVDSRVNYFGRLSYNYKETYLFQFSFRRDGSTRFSKEAGRWGNFPSILAGWRVSNENFWKNNVRFIDYLKLRASWGKLGNDLVLPFQYLSAYSIGQGYTLGSRVYNDGLAVQGAPNPNITWEVGNVYNAGFESLLLKNRLSVNADFFYQKRNRILVKRNASVPDFSGILLPDENFGVVVNKGFELALGYNGRSSDFSYSVNGNVAFARSKIIEFDEPATSVPWQRLTGKPLGSQLVYHATGIFHTADEISKTPHVDGAIPGDIIIQDYNHDGKINSDDQVVNTKTVNPEITYGLSFNLTYKNWSLNGLVQGAGNSSRRVLIELQGIAGNYFAYDANGRWTPDNVNASKPRAFDRNDAYWRTSYVTDYSNQNSAFARMKNLQLAYTIPAAVLSRIHFKSAEIYVSGQNLFLIYNGNKLIDPEVGGIRTMVRAPAAPGVYNYPIMKVYALGARVSL
jgi:TonB-linked SusC/RagA family outer membrane protein